MTVEAKIFPQNEPEALLDEPETLPDDSETWSDELEILPDEPETLGPTTTDSLAEVQARSWRYFALLFLAIPFVLGISSGYLIQGHSWGNSGVPSEQLFSVIPMDFPDKFTPPVLGDAISMNKAGITLEQDAPANLTGLPDSYTIPVSFGDIGPQLLAAGAIDYDRFVQLYAEAGQPLTGQQLDILTQGSDAPVVLDSENAYFLLNFLWALGLTNANPLLTEGPMMQDGAERAGNFASTGGWTLGVKPPMVLYASTPILKLTPEQQARLEEVAQAVYRPCCNNPTAFPDCNHGMAMLALLELMAAQDATVDEMFMAAKYANAFWFPRQTLEVTAFFKNARGLDFDQVDAQEFVGVDFFSGTGFQAVHQWLAENNLLDQLPNSGNKCSI